MRINIVANPSQAGHAFGYPERAPCTKLRYSKPGTSGCVTALLNGRYSTAAGPGQAISNQINRNPRGNQRRATATAATIKTISISGATGLVGSRLVSKLTSSGKEVVVLTRDTQKAKQKLPYPNITICGPSDWQEAISKSQAVVNLAGEPISTRWSESIKQEILQSRVNCTRQLVAAINATPKASRPKVLVSSSAVGFYGTSDVGTFDESSPSGKDFLARVCREWEAAAQVADTRVAVIRTGVVLSPKGGALAKMLPVFDLFMGGPLGSGNQWLSWVHIDDIVGLILEALSNPQFKGVYNGTAPNPVRMSDLCSTIGDIKGKPSWLPVPDFALQGLLGEGAQVVLDGQRVLPVATEKAGYQFQHTHIKPALKSLLV